ncbi:MAG: envelope stress response membrane protein PspB [Pseudomonadota bacterium]
MSDVLFGLAFVFMVVCLPLVIILHYITKWRQNREISGDDEKLLEDLWTMAQTIEDRIDTLERILDTDEEDNWRMKQ